MRREVEGLVVLLLRRPQRKRIRMPIVYGATTLDSFRGLWDRLVGAEPRYGGYTGQNGLTERWFRKCCGGYGPNVWSSYKT